MQRLDVLDHFDHQAIRAQNTADCNNLVFVEIKLALQAGRVLDDLAIDIFKFIVIDLIHIQIKLMNFFKFLLDKITSITMDGG